MATYNESNKKNWLIQINDLNNHQIKSVEEYIESGTEVHSNLGIHHATVAMYLGYKIKAKRIEEPKLTKKFKGDSIFHTSFFPYFKHIKF